MKTDITNIILHGRLTEDDLKSDTELLPTEEASYYNILILVTKTLEVLKLLKDTPNISQTEKAQ